MSEKCRYCRVELAEGDECGDKGACSKRVAKRSLKTLERHTVTKAFVGFNPDKAYADAPKEGRRGL